MIDEQEDESLGVEQLPQAESEASPGSNSVQPTPDKDADEVAHQSAPAKMQEEPKS